MDTVFNGISSFLEASSTLYYFRREGIINKETESLEGLSVSLFDNEHTTHVALNGVSVELAEMAFEKSKTKAAVFDIDTAGLPGADDVKQFEEPVLVSETDKVNELIRVIEDFKGNDANHISTHLTYQLKKVLIVSSFKNKERIVSCGGRTKFSLSMDSVARGSRSIAGFREISMGLNRLPSATEMELFLEYARRMLSSNSMQLQDVTSGNYDCFFAGQAACFLVHEALGHSMEVQNHHGLKDCTDYGNALKNLGYPLSVYDVAYDNSLFGANQFDDLGCKAEKIQLFDDGRLVNYLDFRSENMPCARREDFRHAVLSRMSNTIVDAGETSDEEIIDSMHRGIYISKIIHGYYDAASRTVSFFVSEAFHINKGKVQAPAAPFKIEAPVHSLLSNLCEAGKKLFNYPMFCQSYNSSIPVSISSPSILVKQLPVQPLPADADLDLLSKYTYHE
jgi:TldD protein